MTTLQKIQNLTWWNEISKLKDILTSLFNITENIDIRVINIENTPVTGNYIPLTGTTGGNPVSGGIEVLEVGDNFWIKGIDYDEIINSIKHLLSFSEGSVRLVSHNSTLGIATYLAVTEAEVRVGSDSQNFCGLRGDADYSPNITDLDYTQKIYVDQRGSVVNTTIAVLSASDLNTQYPNAKDGFQVICPNVIGGGKFYIKAGATWQYQAMLLVT